GTFTYALVSVQDASSTACQQAQSGTATITVNPLPTASIGGDAEVCVNGTDPVITFTGANGTAPYTFTYTINGGTPQTVTSTGTSATVNAPTTTAGTFTYALVSVQDASSTACQQAQSGTATVTVNPDATIVLGPAVGTENQTVCINTPPNNITYVIGGGGTGAFVSGVPTGMTGTYNSGVFTISGIPTVSGTFNYTVTTTGTCEQVTTTGTITVNPDATIALSSAAGTENQAICINTAITNITYAIAGGGTGASVTGLPAGVSGTYNAGVFTISGTPTVSGTFNYTVTTIGTCEQVTTTGTITVPSLITASISSTPINCNGGVSTVTITANGGIAPLIYTFNGVSNNTGVFNNIVAGTAYIWTVSDAMNCMPVDGKLDILEPAALTLAASTTSDANCHGSSTGSVTAGAVANVVGTLSYSWKNAAGIEVGTTATVNNLPAGEYTLTVSDNCFTLSNSVTINEPAILSATPSAQATTCKYSEDGSILISATGGTAPYTYSLNGISNIVGEFKNLKSGNYLVIVTDSQGCTFNISAEVLPGNCPPTARDDVFYTMRNQSYAGSIADHAEDPDGDPLNFALASKPSNGTIQLDSNGSFMYSPAIDFTGKDQFRYQVCDPHGACTEATVTLWVLPVVTVNLTPATSRIPEGSQVSITAVLTEPFPLDAYITLNYEGDAQRDIDYVLKDNFQRIHIPAGQTTTTQKLTVHALRDEIKENDEHVIVNIQTTSSEYVLIGTGSVVTIYDMYPESKPVGPEENPDIHPDPLVSPNGDGLGNERFLIYNIAKYPNNEVFIYNRWGNQVFAIKGYDNADRSFNGVANAGLLTNSNKNLIDGVYYYVIYTTDQNGVRKVNKGYFILKR
ncbi:MAG TPA: Ig-like domain-containing protein, partial [Daejeonella sp.]|nr:Ig-like domain-containing protein [Daejeonella sp.]